MSTHLVSNNVNYQLIILKCIIITVGDSNIVLNLTCNGDLLPLTTQTTPSPTATTTTVTSRDNVICDIINNIKAIHN